jgi:hypothetical protein
MIKKLLILIRLFFSKQSQNKGTFKTAKLFGYNAKWLCFVLFLFINYSFGQTNTWDGSSSTAWNTPANWSLNAVPTAAHNVVIPNVTRKPIISIAGAVCSTLTINNTGTGNNTLTINSPGTLVVSGAVTLTSPTNNTRSTILNVDSGVLSAASINLNDSGVNSRDASLRIGTGTVNVTGNITMSGNADRNDISFSGAGFLNIGGTITGGTLNPSTGTVNYNRAGAQTIGRYSYNNLTLSGSGTKTFGAATTVSGNWSMVAGVLADLGTYTHSAGTLVLGGAGPLLSSWGSTTSGAVNTTNDYFSNTGRINVNLAAPYPAIDNNYATYTNGNSGQVAGTSGEYSNPPTNTLPGSLTLTAPAGSFFTNVKFASYGTPGGTSPNFTIGSCHAFNSRTVTTGLLGTNTSKIPNSGSFNDTFGDPCYNTVKSYNVVATYAEPYCILSTVPAIFIDGSKPTGGNGSYTYFWEKSTVGHSTGYTAAPGINNQEDYTVTAGTTQTTWYRRTVTSGIYSDATIVIVQVVTTAPTAPTGITAPQTICAGQSATLSVSGGSMGGSTGYAEWTSGSCDGPVVGTGTTITVTPTANTTYFVKYKNVCGSTACLSTTVRNPAYIVPAANTAQVCYSTSSQTTPLSYSGATGTPTRYSIVWGSVPANSFVPVVNAILPASPISISVPANTPPGTYTGTITVSNAAGCVSYGNNFTVTVNPLPTAYAITGGGAYCSGGTGVVVGLANSASGVNYQLQIGGTNTGSPVAGTGSAISFGLQTVAGTYTVIATNTTTSCTSTMTGSVGISVSPANPTSPIGTYSFCIDSNNTQTTGNVRVGDYALVNIIKGYKYTFNIGDIFSGLDEKLTILNTANSELTANTGSTGTSIVNWEAPFSGQIKVVSSTGNCINIGTAGTGGITLTLNSIGNTQDSQTATASIDNRWRGHIYNWSGGVPPGGASPAVLTTTTPFSDAEYAGYYDEASESITQNFGGDDSCFPVFSDGIQRAGIRTEQFAVRYRMRSTRTGCFLVTVRADDGVRLYVDGVKVVDQWQEQSATTYENVLVNLTGNSVLVLDYYENGGGNVIQFNMIPFSDRPNTISAPATTIVCNGVAAGLIDGSAYTYNGSPINPTIKFQWQYASSATGPWTDAATGTGFNAEDYTPLAITGNTVANITYYRRQISSSSNPLACVSDSNVISITTYPIPAATVTEQPNCIVTTGTITVTSPVAGTNYSIDGLDYTNTNGIFSGVLPGSYTVRARTASGCISTSTPVTVNVPADKIWTGTLNTNWNTAGNWNPTGVPTSLDCVIITNVPNKPVISGTDGNFFANILTVNDGAALTVNSSNTLEVTGKVTVIAGGVLTFENNASLVQINNIQNTGSITYKRDSQPMKNFDYSYWSSPVSGQTTVNLSPNTLSDKYHHYEPAKGWVLDRGEMQPGIGYIIRVPKPNFWPTPAATTYIQPVEFKGVPNNGTFKSSENMVKGEFYLVGNPYPSALDADEFLFENKNNNDILGGTIYFWTHNSAIKKEGSKYVYVSDDYASYNGTGGVASAPSDPNHAVGTPPVDNGKKPTGNIAAGQSFFASAEEGSGNVEFTNEMRVRGNNKQFFKPAKTSKSAGKEKHRLWLNMTNAGGAFKQTLIGYVEGATNTYDKKFDGLSFDGNSYIDFYSVNEADKLTIQARALPFSDTDLVPLGYRSTIAGDFTIAIDQADGNLAAQRIYLEDKQTGTINELTAGNYTFTTKAGTFNNRFVLRYTNKTLGTGDFETQDAAVWVMIQNKTVTVNSTIENIDKVFIYDVSGKQLYQKENVKNLQLIMQNLPFAQQVVLVKVVLDNGYQTTRKVIFK